MDINMNIVNNIIKERLIDKNVKYRYDELFKYRYMFVNLSFYLLDKSSFFNINYAAKEDFSNHDIRIYYLHMWIKSLKSIQLWN